MVKSTKYNQSAPQNVYSSVYSLPDTSRQLLTRVERFNGLVHGFLKMLHHMVAA